MVPPILGIFPATPALLARDEKSAYFAFRKTFNPGGSRFWKLGLVRIQIRFRIDRTEGEFAAFE
jgi:hypothetical protein